MGMIFDLFAGPGGWDVAAERLGLDVVGIELDDDACVTRAAAGHKTIQADLYTYPIQQCEGLIASPPCPAFSMAGKRGGIDDLDHLCFRLGGGRDGVAVSTGEWSDPTSELVARVGMWIYGSGCEWVALEQVPAVLPVWEALAKGLLKDGWRTAWAGVLNSANYGVPQTRKRAILIAHRTRAISAPVPTHAKDPAPTLFGPGEQPWVSMADALGWEGLPHAATESPDEWLERRVRWTEGSVGFARKDDNRGEPTVDGYRNRDWFDTDGPAQVVTEKSRSWILNTRRDQRPDGSTQTRELDEPAPAVTAADTQWVWEQRSRPDNAPDWVDTLPSTTVAAASGGRIASREHHGGREENGGEPLGYSPQFGLNPLKVTVEEAARLQSFPWGYPWHGSQTSRFRQIGNAIPVDLASAILQRVAVPHQSYD